jgi:hypothetical protein
MARLHAAQEAWLAGYGRMVETHATERRWPCLTGQAGKTISGRDRGPSHPQMAECSENFPLSSVSAVFSVNFTRELNQSYRLTRALASIEAIAITADLRE